MPALPLTESLGDGKKQDSSEFLGNTHQVHTYPIKRFVRSLSFSVFLSVLVIIDVAQVHNYAAQGVTEPVPGIDNINKR